jgi:hypothetical protein
MIIRMTVTAGDAEVMVAVGRTGAEAWAEASDRAHDPVQEGAGARGGAEEGREGGIRPHGTVALPQVLPSVLNHRSRHTEGLP